MTRPTEALRRGSDTLLVAAFAVLLAAPAPAADPPPWKVGMVTALSGPSQALGEGMATGVKAYFAFVNAQGGVHGRPLELITVDDGYEPGRTGPAMRQLIDEQQVFAVLGNVGTPTAAVAVPIANEKKVPLFGAFTGAGLLRKTPPDRYVVNFRASYAQETAEMVRGLVTERGLDPSRLAFFTQNDAYGDAGYNGAIAALEKLGYQGARRLPHGRYPRNTVDVEDALARLLDPRVHHQAIVMIGAYRPCAKFITQARKLGLGDALFVNVSFVGSEALAKELGKGGEGVIVTQVVPHFDAPFPLLDTYRRQFTPAQHSFISLEGFAAARAFVEVLTAAGPQATRESFLDALESGQAFDLGLGETHVLSKAQHQFSQRVWPTVIRGGRFQPMTSWRVAGGGVR